MTKIKKTSKPGSRGVRGFALLTTSGALLVTLGLTVAAPGCGETDDGEDDTSSTNGDGDGDGAGDGDGDGDGTGDGDGDGDGEDNSEPGTCAHGEGVGKFLVAHEIDYSSVDGEVLDGVVPVSIQSIVDEIDGCRLFLRETPFCDPPCAANETCNLEDECIPYPERHSVGTVTIDGLEAPVEMEPTGSLTYFQVGLPHPVFLPGGTARLETTGGETDAFSMTTPTFSVLDLGGNDAWTVAEGEDIEVNWVPDESEGDFVRISVNIDQHGNSPITLICDVDDTGSYSVPASLIDQLLNSGVSGFPTGGILRRSVSHTVTEFGCVELELASHLSTSVEVDGHTPCDSDEDCPDGQTCDIPNNTCV